MQCTISAIKFVFRLYEHDWSHFLGLKLIYTKKICIGFSAVYSFKIIHGMSPRTLSNKPRPL